VTRKFPVKNSSEIFMAKSITPSPATAKPKKFLKDFSPVLKNFGNNILDSGPDFDPVFRRENRYRFFRVLDRLGCSVWAGTDDFGSDARRLTAALNLAAAVGPSLKSSGPKCGLIVSGVFDAINLPHPSPLPN
jgi:hypothetical protein